MQWDLGCWFCVRMVGTVRMAARLLFGSKLHHFYAGAVRVVGVEAVLAVAADFGTVEGLKAIGPKLGRRIVNVLHAE